MFFNMKIFKEYISHAILKILKGGSLESKPFEGEISSIM